jgi:uric acid transporter
VSTTGGAARVLHPVHPVDEKLPALKMATTGLQHVAAMHAGAVAPWAPPEAAVPLATPQSIS